MWPHGERTSLSMQTWGSVVRANAWPVASSPAARKAEGNAPRGFCDWYFCKSEVPFSIQEEQHWLELGERGRGRLECVRSRGGKTANSPGSGQVGKRAGEGGSSRRWRGRPGRPHEPFGSGWF